MAVLSIQNLIQVAADVRNVAKVIVQKQYFTGGFELPPPKKNE
jgi:hypothetical protein